MGQGAHYVGQLSQFLYKIIFFLKKGVQSGGGGGGGAGTFLMEHMLTFRNF